jgi:hypothetical protein
MPYWAYHVEQNAPVEMPATHTYRRGNYRITDHFALNCQVDAYYKGLSYDASSSFYDSISQYIGPYDVRNMKEFHPAILSGFYGDNWIFHPSRTVAMLSSMLMRLPIRQLTVRLNLAIILSQNLLP